MAVLSKDIKAERKSNAFKKTLTLKEEFSIILSVPNNTKNPKDKNTNINSKTKTTCCLMIDASEGAEGYMILTRRVAAVPVTIDLYPDHVFLEHGFYLLVYLFVSLDPGTCSSCISQCPVLQVSSLLSSCFLPMENLSKAVTELSSSFISSSLTSGL